MAHCAAPRQPRQKSPASSPYRSLAPAHPLSCHRMAPMAPRLARRRWRSSFNFAAGSTSPPLP
eukprot:5790008-Prymnesium_polylepis.1